MEGSAPLRAPAPSVPVALIVLNYNGRSLLEAHLPSVIAAAARSRHACQVWVLDNSSTDDSLCWLAQHYPQVRVWQAPNLGLVSYNELLAQLEAPVVILLNNDIQMDATAVDPLVEPLAVQLALPRERRRWFMTAPACWLMSDGTYEGFRTAVAWRWGLVQATARFPGHEAGISCRGPTASAGAVMAVDRESFLALGGFDLRYAPGRLEDLDLCYRAFLAGQECLYVPESVVQHRGQATFDAVLGEERTQALALRNTLLFQWKNLRHPWHLLRFAASQPVRLAYECFAAPWRAPAARWRYARALVQAWQRQRMCRTPPSPAATPAISARQRAAREREFFRRFAPRKMRQHSAAVAVGVPPEKAARTSALPQSCTAGPLPPAPAPIVQHPSSPRHTARLHNYPLSRWWLMPLASRASRLLAPTAVRPWHVSVAGLMLAAAAAVVCLQQPGGSAVAALLAMTAWFCDRVDGQLARLQQRQSPQGAWLDANLDELGDLLVHAAAAAGLAHAAESFWPWVWLAVFLSGKYLLMYGLAEERALCGHVAPAAHGSGPPQPATPPPSTMWRLARAAWHWPSHADVRAHLTAAALASGLLAWELAAVGLYYHLRWAVRYGLVLHRLRAVRPAEVQG
ncbi:MAG: glycosyltransferase [Pirellulales bacterium]|nr:glycosyltransferase [Pirellulales bacterium]